MNVELIEPETSTELSVQDRAALALGSSKTEQSLKALAVKNAAIVAILDKAGREQAHGAAMELKSTRVAIGKTSKAARDDATKFSKAVIAEEARLIAIIQPEETRLLGLRDDWDTLQAEIKAEAERVERSRIMAINERISELRGFVNLALECRTSERVAALIEKLTAAEVTSELFQEFEAEAVTVKEAALVRMTDTFNQKKGDEDERAHVKAEQEAAAETLRKQQEETAAAAKKLADERAAHEAKLEADRLALAEQARQIAADRAALEASKVQDPEAMADYAAAISAPIEPSAPANIAPAATETVAVDQPAEALVLSGEMLSIEVEPAQPSANALISAVAAAFNVPMYTAAEWLVSEADAIAEYQYPF